MSRRPSSPSPSSLDLPPFNRRGLRIPQNEVTLVEGHTRPTKAAYFNRELSWLSFNRRVLEQARNPDVPLLERVKFLAIVCSNLDEFFEIRVAGLIQQVDAGSTKAGIDGLGPREQLRRIHSVVASLVDDQYRAWHDELVPALATEGIRFKAADELTSHELRWVEQYFEEQVFPVLTPLGLDQSHPFPQLSNKTLNVIVSLDDPATPEEERQAALLPVPRILPRLVRVETDGEAGDTYIFLSEIIKRCAESFFPGYRVNGAHAFRVTRNSDLYIDEEEAENLLKTIEEELRNLRRGAAVRLEIEEGVSHDIFTTLCEHLELSHEYVFRLNGPLNLLRLMSVTDIDRPDLKYSEFVPVPSAVLPANNSPFKVIRERDVMLYHPYDSFGPVVDFVTAAAHDPDVLSMKQTLYRTSGDSPIVRALIDASRNGKQVTALVELKARFDEANNIQWARQLEEAGVLVIFGVVGHKTHCKCSLVVRREGAKLRRYVHLGTGNYNPKTARLYTDLSLFTSREDITEDVANTFNTLTGFSREPEFERLLVAPFNLHTRMIELIDVEAANAAAGKPARIMAKMNSLVDKATIDHLYTASQAGVQIDLIVRGICCLVPGVPGLSENIRVRSIVGRYLEHARIFYFQNAEAEPHLFAGSADWMPRNFFRRIEVIFPIDDEAARNWIIDELFASELKDTTNARELHSNGAYVPTDVAGGESPFSVQNHFVEAAEARRKQQAQFPEA
jgi:polyphosphate kinase